MRFNIRYRIVLIYLFFVSFPSIAEKVHWPFPTASAEKAIFKIESSLGDDTWGTGFIIEREGEPYIVTAFHGVEILGPEGLRAGNKFIENLEIEGLIGVSFLNDLALIKVKKGYKGPVLKLANNIRASHKRAYMLGFPDGRLKETEFIQINDSTDSRKLYGFRVNNSFSLEGSSGSPLFNSKGDETLQKIEEKLAKLKWQSFV